MLRPYKNPTIRLKRDNRVGDPKGAPPIRATSGVSESCRGAACYALRRKAHNESMIMNRCEKSPPPFPRLSSIPGRAPLAPPLGSRIDQRRELRLPEVFVRTGEDILLRYPLPNLYQLRSRMVREMIEGCTNIAQHSGLYVLIR